MKRILVGAVVLLWGTAWSQESTAPNPPPGVAALPAAKTTARQTQWQRASIDERVGLAEQIGEEGAEGFAAKNGYEPLLRNGDKVLRQGFDQVYRAKDGRIVV